jgi:hypothetical protein
MPLTNPQPLPGDVTPPAISDTGALGADVAMFARADHTHPSKLRRARAQTAANGIYTWTFDPPFDVGVVPRVYAVAETAQGVTDVINAQIEGTPTNTAATIRVTRTQQSVVALLGLTILSIPAQPGQTWVHAFAASN